MTRAMTDSELMDLIESLSFGLDDAEKRISKLETRLHDHEQAVPHAEAAS
jgi:hypothetical protein